MRKLLYIVSFLLFNQYVFGGNVQTTNFADNKEVAPSNVLSKYENNTVIFFRNDSAFVANINEDGELQNITYDKELEKLHAEGQIAYDKTNKMAYYSRSGKLFVSSKDEKGKWAPAKPIVLKGTEVSRDKYRGSVLAYSSWRYMPKDSVVVLNPAISEDGLRLYFASNMQDSKGLDLWYAEKKENGEWGEPVKVPYVNTEADENFPFVREDGNMTYASNRVVDGEKPKEGSYNLFFYNPDKPNRTILLDNLLSEDLKEPELLADDKISYKDSTLLAENPEKQGVNGNTGNGGSSDLAYDDPIMGKSENEKILEAYTKIDTAQADKKIEQQSLVSSFEANRDTVLQASRNVLATVDKRIFYFDYDKDVLDRDYEKDIEVLLEFINYYPNSSFLVIGHTDERGSYEYNDALSMKRARRVQNILIHKGVSKSRLHVMGLGEYKPVIREAETEAEHQMNRRVEIQRME
ncbi:MAG: OmpA family protein [Paludibacteraceae bacterium]|nr:OmpA family protein [Paludibacteraceae bacterium]MBR4841017.1 OmpA family protein [Paludibacteraceae bacterium]